MQEFTTTELQAFIAHAYGHAAGVRRWLDGAGVDPAAIVTVADLARIPVLSKDRMIELQAADPPFGGFLAAPMTAVHRIFQSPGPLYEPQGAEHAAPAGVEIVQRAGFAAGDVVLNCLGYHLSPGGFLLDHMLRAAGCTVVPAGIGAAELQVKFLAELGATGYAGLPSWLLTLFQKAQELGVPQEAIKLRRALFSGEPLFPHDRARLVNDYGLTVVNAYATAELGVLAYDLDGAPAMRLADHPIIQIVDHDTGQEVGPGEAGEVVVTNLSALYPLVRFGTGDLAMLFDPAPGASRQGERAIRLVGRVGDAVKVRGMFVHPNQLRAALGQAGVTAFHAVVRRPAARDELTVRVALPGGDLAAVQEPMQRAVREICRVSVDRFEVADDLGDQAGKITDER
jgi:phenylacetate-CoA ligase